MGADMIVSGFVISLNKTEMKDRWLNSASLFEERLLKLKKLVSKERSFSSDHWSDLMEYYDDLYNRGNINKEEHPTFKRWLEIQIDNAIDCLGNRETTEWFVKPNKFLMISGGMSWGDSPTETLDVFDRINRMPRHLLEEAGLE